MTDDDPYAEARAALYRDRARAESFGAVAEAYDLYRPEFPPALLDELATLGREVLDIGSGTGKVARALVQRGASVVGVEIDPAMAAVARAHGVAVEVSPFERWDAAGRRFDLVTCGDAWHWLEPVAAAARCAELLRPGGALVRFFNLQTLAEPVMQALDPVYAEHAPEVHVYGRMPDLAGVDVFPITGPFTCSELRTFTWEREVTAESWTGFAATISDHQRLTAAKRDALLAAVRSTLATFTPPLRVRGTTFASFATSRSTR